MHEFAKQISQLSEAQFFIGLYQILEVLYSHKVDNVFARRAKRKAGTPILITFQPYLIPSVFKKLIIYHSTGIHTSEVP